MRRARTLLTAGAFALALVASAQAFVPNDPLAGSQWYLGASRVFDAWPEQPLLAPVRVAVIDSGIDRSHPELRGRIAAARSFVGGTVDDTQGHGTIVAGLIAARTDDGVGIAGLAPAAQLVVAKVVGEDGLVEVRAEARAIRWAVDRGARIVNISLGGPRDPRNVDGDAFEQEEADAIAYAVAKGVLVVAAVGNGDQAPREPWPYANYPAALPHVLGVGALGRKRNVPSFSNRDAVHVDLVAPGVGMVSTFPEALTAAAPGCGDQGYTLCASGEYRSPEGTSFAAPVVTAAAANLLGIDPSLSPDQLRALLTRSAVDATPATGCRRCTAGHDRLSGFGMLDAAAAIARLGVDRPSPDRFEPNNGPGARPYRLYGGTRTVRATADYYDDERDAYEVYLRAGQRLSAQVAREPGAVLSLSLWGPGGDSAVDRPLAAIARPDAGGLQWLAERTGWHLLELGVSAPGARVAYRLSVSRR